jgi:hypothetical protein
MFLDTPSLIFEIEKSIICPGFSLQEERFCRNHHFQQRVVQPFCTPLCPIFEIEKGDNFRGVVSEHSRGKAPVLKYEHKICLYKLACQYGNIAVTFAVVM